MRRDIQAIKDYINAKIEHEIEVHMDVYHSGGTADRSRLNEAEELLDELIESPAIKFVGILD